MRQGSPKSNEVDGPTPPSNRLSLTSRRLTGVAATLHLLPFITPLTNRELPAPPPTPPDVPPVRATHCDSPQLHYVTALFDRAYFCIHYIRPEGLFSSWDLNYVHLILPCDTGWWKYTCFVVPEEGVWRGSDGGSTNMVQHGAFLVHSCQHYNETL